MLTSSSGTTYLWSVYVVSFPKLCPSVLCPFPSIRTEDHTIETTPPLPRTLTGPRVGPKIFFPTTDMNGILWWVPTRISKVSLVPPAATVESGGLVEFVEIFPEQFCWGSKCVLDSISLGGLRPGSYTEDWSQWSHQSSCALVRVSISLRFLLNFPWS